MMTVPFVVTHRRRYSRVVTPEASIKTKGGLFGGGDRIAGIRSFVVSISRLKDAATARAIGGYQGPL